MIQLQEAGGIKVFFFKQSSLIGYLYGNYKFYFTFLPSSDVEEAIFVFLADISRPQPELVVEGLSRLLLLSQIAHENMPAIHANLRGIKISNVYFYDTKC